MSVTIKRDFAPADRYLYDFKVLTIEKGWAQLDTRQDASYYGHWINPVTREIFSYCEGDTCLTTCETDAEMQAYLADMTAWNVEMGYAPFRNGKPVGIDPGFNTDLKMACIGAGLSAWMHQ